MSDIKFDHEFDRDSGNATELESDVAWRRCDGRQRLVAHAVFYGFFTFLRVAP